MPIRPPRLDDRAFPDLVAEALARIPAHTPEYTHPLPGDPGHTMIELFAWLTDTLLYRVNLIPERQRLEFLRIVGVPLRGARAAKGLVALSFGDIESASAPIEVETLRPWCIVKAGSVELETRRTVSVLPVTGVPYHKRRLREPELSAMAPLLGDLAQLYELAGANPLPYVTTPTYPDGKAVPLGVDLVRESVDGALWIALLAGKPEGREAARLALGRDIHGQQQVLTVGVVPARSLGDAIAEELSGIETSALPVPVVWEISTGRSRASGVEMHELEVLHDTTAGLTRIGVVELLLPSADQLGPPDNDVRTQIDAGVGARPPRLDDETLNDRLVAWVRLRPKHGVDQLALSWAGVHAVEIDHKRTLSEVIVGVSSGEPDQRIQLPLGSVERATFALQVEEERRGWVDWQLVDHLALVGPGQRACALEDEEGIVVFGDRVRGAVPERGRRIRVRFMRAGGGLAGNLAACAIDAISARRARDGSQPARPFNVLQPIPTMGGAAAETLEEAERRIPDVLRHRDRAVTREDVVACAAGTPGVRLGRVEVIKGFKPHQRRANVPGVVSVMVLPRVDGVMPPNPRPSRHTIEAVHAWLSDKVPLATELYVIGCEYRPIGISAGFELREGADREATLAAVRFAIRRLLWPLAPGGPFEDASGWPRGRAVRERELTVAIARVPGVDEVLGVRLFVRRANGTYRRARPGADGSAEIPLHRWQLPELLKLSVVADEEPSDSLDPSEVSTNEIAIPVVPEVC